MKLAQSYLELARALQAIMDDYGIKEDQITNIVTDGGSAFTKMFKKFGTQVDIISETVSDEDDDAENDDDDDDIAENSTQQTNRTNLLFMTLANGEMLYSEVLNLEERPSSSEHVEDIDDILGGVFQPPEPNIKLPPQRWCVSHILNLLGKDFEKNLDSTAKTAFLSAYSKIHSLWVFTCSHTAAPELRQFVKKCWVAV